MKKKLVVVYSGYIVLIAIVLLLLSMTFLRGGHPPGSGIVNVMILVCVYPISLLGAILGLNTPGSSISGSAKTYYIMTGVCLSFALFTTMIFVLKYIFGQAV